MNRVEGGTPPPAPAATVPAARPAATVRGEAAAPATASIAGLDERGAYAQPSMR